VSAIYASSRFVESRAPKTGSVAVYDVGDCIKSWGRRGILAGAILGLALGAIFAAMPLTTEILTFGVLGTMIVAAVECAAIGGGFGALAAALYGKGVRRNSAPGLERTFAAERRLADANWREVGVTRSALPHRWGGPGPSTEIPVLENTGDYAHTANSSLPDIQTELDGLPG
jgi:hypothetical protein